MSDSTLPVPVSAGLLVLRIATGALMASLHGFGKLTSYGEKAATWADPIGLGPEVSLALAIFSEFFCAVLIVLGLATRAAAIPFLITMLVAAFVVHADDPWGKKELALLYAAPALALILTGPGAFSLDAMLAPFYRRFAPK